MSLFTFSPFTNLRDMQRSIDSLANNFVTPRSLQTTCEPCDVAPVGGGTGSELINFSPSLDVKDTDKAILLHVELPGVPKEDIKLTVEDNKLTIQGEKKFKKKDEGENWVRKERAYGKFFRVIVLPPGIDANQVQANYESGVLEIVIPKNLEQHMKHTIEIGDKSQQRLAVGDREPTTGEQTTGQQQKTSDTSSGDFRGEKDRSQQQQTSGSSFDSGSKDLGDKGSSQQKDLPGYSQQTRFESTGERRQGLDTGSQSAQT